MTTFLKGADKKYTSKVDRKKPAVGYQNDNSTNAYFLSTSGQFTPMKKVYFFMDFANPGIDLF